MDSSVGVVWMKHLLSYLLQGFRLLSLFVGIVCHHNFNGLIEQSLMDAKLIKIHTCDFKSDAESDLYQSKLLVAMSLCK